MNNAIKPDHYRKGRQYQPWDVAKNWDFDFDLGSVLKYIGRCGRKAGNSKIQDLKKAAEFLKHEIVVTANLREWRNIFKLRAVGVTGKPHPQMVEVMVSLLEEVKKQISVVFDDLVTE